MATNIDTLTIEIEASADSAVKKINDLTKSLSKLKSSLSGINGNGLSSIAGNLQNLSRAAGGLSQKSINKLKDLSTAIKEMSGIKGLKIDPGFAQSLQSIIDMTSTVDDSKIQVFSRIGAALKDMQGTYGINKDAATSLKAIVDAVSEVSEDSIARLERLGEALGKLSGFKLPKISEANLGMGDSGKSGVFQRASEGLKNLWSGLKQKIKLAIDSSDVKNAKKEVSGLVTVMNAMKRIAFYRLIRTAIKAIGQAFKEGAENAYYFSQAIGGDLAASLDSLASRNFTATNQLGAAWATLLQTITPILIQIINLINRVAQAITQLFALLGGKTTYLKATDYAVKYADAAKSGAKATKEWKNQLMGFDEINRLDEPTESNGGGGGAGIPDYGAMFEETPLGEWFQKLRDITLDWWKTVDLEPFTKAWNRLKVAVGDFIDIVNDGLYWAYTNVLLPFAKWRIEKSLPAELNMVAAAFELLNTVLRKLAPYFQDFFENTIKPFAEYIGNKYVDAINDLTGTLESLRIKVENASSFGEFVQSLDGKETILFEIAAAITAIAVASAVFNTVTSGIELFTNALKFLSSPMGIVVTVAALMTVGLIELYQHSEKAREIMDGLGEKIKTLVKNIQDYFKEFDGLSFGESVEKIFSDLSTAIQNVDWHEVGASAWNTIKEAFTWAFGKVSEAFADINFGDIAKSFFELLGSALGGALSFLDGVTKEIHDSLISKLISVFDNDGDGKVTLGEIGKAIINGVYEGMKLILVDFGGWVIDNVFKPFWDGFKKAFGIASPASEMMPIGENILLGILEGIKLKIPDVSALIDDIKKSIVEKWETVKNDFSTAFGGIAEAFEDCRTQISEKVTSLNESWEGFKTTVTQKWQEIKNEFSSGETDTNSVIENIKSFFSSMGTKWEDIKKAIGQHWEELKGAFTSGKESVETDSTETETIWDTFGEKWSQIKDDVANKAGTLGTDFQSMKESVKTHIEGLQSFFGNLWNDWSTSAGNIISDVSAVISSFWDANSSIGSSLSGISSYFVSLDSTVHSVLQDIITGLATVIQLCVDALSALNSVSVASASNPALQRVAATPAYASGGLVDTGELFIAREAGPELVGTIGGRTAVANNDQIVDGIREGVYEAVSAAMVGTGGRDDTPIYIYLDGNQIAKTTTKYQKQYARAVG